MTQCHAVNIIKVLKKHMNNCAIHAPYEMNCFEIKEIYTALEQQQAEIVRLN